MHITNSEYHAMLRGDLSAFIQHSFYELNPQILYLPNWHIEAIASALEACRRGEITRLIINVPPRSLKSHCATVVFPAWLLGHNPSASIICASYGQDLSDKHARDCRRLMASEAYQEIFPTRLSPERHAVQEFATTANGFRMATSVGGTLTGRGGDFMIIDDPLKPDEALSDNQRKAANDWFDHTLYSRLNNKKTGCIIIIMQRLHEDDLVGHVLGQEPWTVLRLPAIAEQDETHVYQTPFGQRTFVRRAGEALHHQREPLETLEVLRQTLGEYNFAGQYQQAPAPLGGGLIKREWFRTYTNRELPETFESIFQSWDTANKATDLSDHSVCTTWGVKQKKLYLLDVFRRRLEYPELKRMVRSQADIYRPRNVVIEDKASGTQLIQELIQEGMRGVTKYDPKKMDKIMRLSTASNLIENGVVYIPESASWLDSYLHEVTIFPNGKFDDQADSTSQALDWYKERSREPGIIAFYRTEYMRQLREDGEWAELKELEDEYGPLED